MPNDKEPAVLMVPGSHGISVKEFEAHVAEAQGKAAILKSIVDNQHLYVMIGESKHLELEAWLTIARGYGYSARIAWTHPLEDGGYEARAEAIDGSGNVVAAAEAECGTEGDENWISKPNFQQRSMAQTRAIAKALRSSLSWVVVLAGYKATPAEEMTGAKDSSSEAPMGFCPVHKVAFQHRTGTSKTGKPYDFWACPRKDGNEFCKKEPQDWLTQQLAELGLGNAPALRAWMAAQEIPTWKDFIGSRFYQVVVADIRGRMAKDADQAQPKAEPQPAVGGGQQPPL